MESEGIWEELGGHARDEYDQNLLYAYIICMTFSEN